MREAKTVLVRQAQLAAFVATYDRDRRLLTDAKIVPYETVASQHRELICTLKIAPPRQKQDRDRRLLTDAKIVPYETVASQHRELICTLKIAPPRQKQVERCGAPKTMVTTVDDTWKKATEAIRQATQLGLGITKPGRKVDKQAHDVKAKKTEYLTMDVTESSSIKVNGIELSRTSAFRYLGSAVALTAKWWLKWIHAQPVAVYGAESWPAVKEAKTRLSVMETKMLRWTAGVTHMDRIQNDVIRQKFGVAPIVDKMRKARLRWYGYVLRGEEDSVRKIDLNFEAAGVHPDLALDRERWRHDTRIADPATKRDRR
ncbi:unnamed protein product [Heligmosomoides polygyrus]|uniref:Reverse transcriptase n=1 Tax=Heligmosomoides polygyrus TaxID=6339 RepID=A0A183GK88_HELPZ|nr:unnamed protein product [Heligmosomoides polygyrus]